VLTPDLRTALNEADIRAELAQLVRGLRSSGERSWAKRLERSASLFDVAHYLWWLRRDRCGTFDRGAIERLLYAIGLTFPAPGPPPVQGPFMVGPLPR
jgi:hypothetical protein